MTPIQGNWTISSIGLPPPVLRKIYFDNARQLLARSLPTPVLQARRTARDFVPDGDLTKTLWQTVTPVFMDAQAGDGHIRASLSTTVRCLWSSNYLYLAYSCPFTNLTTFDPPQEKPKRFDLDQRRRQPVGPRRGRGLHRQRRAKHQPLHRVRSGALQRAAGREREPARQEFRLARAGSNPPSLSTRMTRSGLARCAFP